MTADTSRSEETPVEGATSPGDSDPLANEPDEPTRTPNAFRRVARRFVRNKTAVAALILLVLIMAASLLAPLLAPYHPNEVDIANRLSGPSAAHLLGTDALGRDTLSRLLYAGRVSVSAAVLAVTVASVLGIPSAMIAGYSGGRIDWCLNRVADILMTFPSLVLTIAIIAATGPGLTKAMISLGVVYAPRVFRVVRGATLAVRQETYVEASVSIGTPTRTIIRKRVLPNILSPTLVQVSLLLASALLAEVTISLLGLGALPPTASWGSMLGQAFQEMRSNPMLVVYPGIAVALTSLAFNLFGDGLRDSFGREIRKG